jgi:hypothetical protein
MLDVLVLYPTNVDSLFGGGLASAQAEDFVDLGNQTFARSGINIRLNLLAATSIGLLDLECNSSALTLLDSHYEANHLRRLYKPHLTVALCNNPTGNISGTARFPGQGATKSGLAVSLFNDHMTFIHEIGHNLGVGHGRRLSGIDSGNPIATSRGFGIIDNYRDVMTYSEAFGSAVQYSFFSNRSLTTCANRTGVTCGTSSENAAGGIPNIYRDYVSKYKSHWANLTPPQATTFRFSIPNPVGNMKIEMVKPYKKTICEPNYNYQIYNCEYTSVMPGEHHFQLTAPVSNWRYVGCGTGTNASTKTCAHFVAANSGQKNVEFEIDYTGTSLPETNVTFVANFYVWGGGGTQASLYDNGRKLCDFQINRHMRIYQCTARIIGSTARLELRGSELDRIEWNDHTTSNHSSYGSCEPQENPYRYHLCNIRNLNGNALTKPFNIWVYD